jgi:hypothetical protein
MNGRRFTSGNLTVQRTGSGYIAVLRVQGADGSSVGFVSRVSESAMRDAAGEVGFSFAKLAKSIGRAAEGVAKSKVFKTFISAAKFLPPPISAVATAADGAAKVLLAMRKKGDPAALAEWKRAAAKARANPTSPIAAGMRLAMQAAGPPRMRSPQLARATSLVREVLAELDAPSDAAPADAAPVEVTP